MIMKKLMLLTGILAMTAGVVSAQDKNAPKEASNITVRPAASVPPDKILNINPSQAGAAPAAKPTSLKAENMFFKSETHDFGNIAEGPNADHEFVFKNTGKEPIILERVQASCGCTTPSYSKDPVLPGKTGTIKASYATQGRPGPFTKSITITSNIGMPKVLTIKGTVEKAPESSVPQNSSMIKTH
jgi:hypothetical protein